MKNLEDNNIRKMKFFGDTHLGNVREENQDNFSIVEYDSAVCLTVCDGMGGENGGSVASATAIKAYHDYIKDNMNSSVLLY